MKKSLFGYGTITQAIAKSGGFDIFDDKFIKLNQDEFGNNLLPSKAFDPSKSTLEIVSPGFKPNHELVLKANNLTSEYDYFYHLFPKNVWISGTNGKTTTTQMLHHLLKNKGAIIGGNIGEALANLDKNAPLWILETSSFMMHYTKKAKPNLYLLLPIAQDHLDWHKNFEEYENAKLSPLQRMNEKDVAILPQKYKNIQSNAKLYFYENEYDLAKTFDIDIKKINIKSPFLLDSVLALAAEKVLFDNANIDMINNFKIDHYKIEEFLDHLGRTWVNDTKGTNDNATIAALKRYEKQKIHLILGGVDKGLDSDELFTFMTKCDINIYSIGTTAEKIANTAKKFNIKCEIANDIQTAVKKIDKVLNLGEIAMLSPATSSFDQFDSYKHRGDVFMQCVKSIS